MPDPAARSLSIGVVTPTVSRAGGGIFPIVLAHARELSRSGHKVTIYGLDDDADLLDRHSWSGLDLRLYRNGRFGYSGSLEADLRRGTHDVLHQHGLWLYLSVAVSRWRKATGKPVVVSSQGMLELWALANSAWKKSIASALYERGNVRRASSIHCSEVEISGVRSYAPNCVVAVLPNGTELPNLERVPPAPSDIFPTDRRILLFFGRLHPKKGVAELIQAWAIIKQSRPEVSSAWRLVVVGWDDGGHGQGFEALARSLGFGKDELLFPGPRFGLDKAALLSHADAFILPSYSEGFPMAVLEAWSYALPVFMTRECNVPEGFEAGAAVEITNQPEALAKVLADRLMRGDLPAMGAFGRDLVAHKYSWPAIVSDLTSVYQWLINEAPKPSFVYGDSV